MNTQYPSQEKINNNINRECKIIKENYTPLKKFYDALESNQKIRKLVDSINKLKPNIILYTVAQNHMKDKENIAQLEEKLNVQLDKIIKEQNDQFKIYI